MTGKCVGWQRQRWMATAAMDGDGSDGWRQQRWMATSAMGGGGSVGTTSTSVWYNCRSSATNLRECRMTGKWAGQ